MDKCPRLGTEKTLLSKTRTIEIDKLRHPSKGFKKHQS